MFTKRLFVVAKSAGNLAMTAILHPGKPVVLDQETGKVTLEQPEQPKQYGY
jgi:hypothetical protein